ncbi:MAG: DUF4340 domain-containing protein [Magnetococcales bacterium]|nr:DUF4340 domain-containing protein [Magnetococcales bacterium]
MKRLWSMNLVLLAIVLAGGYFLIWQDKQERAKKEQEEASRSLLSWPLSEVTGFRFRGEDRKTLQLAKKESAWQVVDPLQAKANAVAVDQLLNALKKPYDRLITRSAEQLADFGLDEKAIRVEVTDDKGRHEAIRVGGENTSGTSRYLLLEATGSVVLIAKQPLTPLLQKSDGLRDKSLLADLSMAGLQAIHLTRPSGELHLVHRDKEGWRMESPFQDATEESRLKGWLDMVLMASGTAFVPNTPPATVPYRLRLERPSAPAVEVVIWKEQDKVMAFRYGQPDALQMPSYFAEDMEKAPFDLLSLRVLSESKSLSHLKLEGADKSVEALRKSDGTWPDAAWASVEEALTRVAHKVETPGEIPSSAWKLQFQAGEESGSLTGWWDTDRIVLAPPGRPVHLALSPKQSTALQESLHHLIGLPAPPKEAPPAKTAETVKHPGIKE